MSFKSRPGDRLLTLKDVAHRIAVGTSEESVHRVARQLRHWTQNDLLRPHSGKSTGTGIPRLYKAEPTLEIAVILMELSRYGATIEIMKPVADELYDDESESSRYLFNAATDDGFAYLQVSWMVDSKTGAFTDAKFHFFDIMEGFERENPDDTSTSSILLNLNKLFERIYPYPDE